MNRNFNPKENEGKKPDLFTYNDELKNILDTLIRRVKRNEPKNKKIRLPSQKEVILKYLLNAVDEVSNGGKLRFSERQLYYHIRPMVIKETGSQLRYNYFSQVITDYESSNGNIPKIYRDTRGILYEPHGYDKPLGTQMVEEYQWPTWQYNKVLYCEKEGLFEVLKDVKFSERHDCALLTSKGFATRAAKDLIDKIAKTDERSNLLLRT